MEPLRATFNCSFQDLPVIGAFVLASARRDQAELATRSIKYKTDQFFTDYEASLKAVNELVNPASFTARHKLLTERIEADARKIRPLLNNLDIRLADATELPAPNPQLTIAPADFGLKGLRAAITDGDAEGIAQLGKLVLGNLTLNAAALAAVEYPAAEQTQLAALIQALTEANVEQNALISARDAQVQANLHVLNSFYDRYLGRVLADGKKAYKEVDAAKTHDYTFARLKARVAAQRPAARRKKSTAPTT